MAARNLARSRSICRRLFLRGTGGVVVGLPFMPSVAIRRAHAADPIFPRQKFFYFLQNEHGGAYDSNMFPAQSTLTEQLAYADAGHTVRWGRLAASASGGNASLSRVLTASSAALPPSLVGKINVLRGLDTAMHVGHHRAGVLGNFADTNGAGRLGLEDRPTIDQIMAYSPSFYPTTQGLKIRSMVYGPSWGYTNTATQSGSTQPVSGRMSSRDLFDRVFVPSGTPKPAARQSIVDRVMENYRRLRNGDRRLSGEDRRRLDDHIARLAEVQALVEAAPGGSCGNHSRPTENYGAFPGDLKKYAGLLHDVFAIAFACGSSRIATLSLYGFTAAGFGGNWHQEVAHLWEGQGGQQWLVKLYAAVFQDVFLDLARKLDAIESAPGRTVLDDSLLVWTQEAGMETHWQVSLPVVTAGSAGGYFKTGLFVDYRNMSSPHQYSLGSNLGADDRTRAHGLLYNQFLATALQSMGVTRPEFERWGHRGYGQPGFGTVANEFPHQMTRNYYQGESGKHFQIASNPLPVITA